MAVIIFAMLVIFGIAAATGAVVLVGMEGRWRDRAPQVADYLTRAARHLNGDGRPPRRLTRLLGSR